MRYNKKAASDVAASKSGGENKTICQSSVSENYSITAAGDGQGRIEGLLLHGAENAIPTAQLVILSGFRSARDMQKAIEFERAHGALILSKGGSGGGYFLPADGEAGQRELFDFIQTLQARALNTLKALRSAKAALQIMPGQLEVDSESENEL